jgi:hypothetical protein
MFISTSDDYEIKIWRSQSSIREQGIAEMDRAKEVRVKNVTKGKQKNSQSEEVSESQEVKSAI